LVVGDAAVVDDDPVGQGAAGGFVETDALGVFRPGGGVPEPVVVDAEVAAGDVGLQAVEQGEGVFGQDDGFQAAGQGASEGGEQGAGACLELGERVVDQGGEPFVLAGVQQFDARWRVRLRERWSPPPRVEPL